MTANNTISHEDFILLHKLSDQLVTANTQVELLRNRRNDNREVTSMFKENKFPEDTRLFLAVGKHFMKHKKVEAFAFIEADQQKTMKEIKEKEKLIDDLKKKIRKLNPRLDLLEYDAYNLIAPDLEDEDYDDSD